jgi:hypothetical protein
LRLVFFQSLILKIQKTRLPVQSFLVQVWFSLVFFQSIGLDFKALVLFPTSFTPKGMSQGDKDGATPPATVAAGGVRLGAGEGDLLKTCDRIENSGARHLKAPASPKPWRAWEIAVDVVGSTSLMLNSTIYSVTTRYLATPNIACWLFLVSNKGTLLWHVACSNGNLGPT